MKDFGARISNMEANKDTTEPKTATHSNRVGEVSQSVLDTQSEIIPPSRDKVKIDQTKYM